MSFSEYDRNLLKEFRNTLYEIRDFMAENLEMQKEQFRYFMQTHNKQAKILQGAMRNHLRLMEEANEEDE